MLHELYPDIITIAEDVSHLISVYVHQGTWFSILSELFQYPMTQPIYLSIVVSIN